MDKIVNYLLLLVNDVNHFFTILMPVSVLRLNAHGNGQIQIQFHAKKIQSTRGKAKIYIKLSSLPNWSQKIQISRISHLTRQK